MALISVCFTVVVTISACFAMYFAVCYNTVGLGDGAIGHCMFGAWGNLFFLFPLPTARHVFSPTPAD